MGREPPLGAASCWVVSVIAMLQQLWALVLNSKSDVTHVIDITRSFVWHYTSSRLSEKQLPQVKMEHCLG